MADRADVLLDIPSTGTLGTDAVGAEATDRASSVATAATVLLYLATATSSGYITKIELYVAVAMTTVKIGTFYADAVGYSTRGYANFGSLAAGKHTLTTDVDGNPLAIRIEAGDVLGLASTGTNSAIEMATTGGSGYKVASGEIPAELIPCYSQTFGSTSASRIISLKAYISARSSHLLATDHNGNLAWTVEEAPVLRPGLSQGQVSYADVPPEQEMVWDTQRTMHGGFGQLEWVDPTRYMSADKVDARFKNKVFCGPLLVTSALAPNETNLLGPINSACEHGGDFFIGAGRAVYQNRPYKLVAANEFSFFNWAVTNTGISFTHNTGSGTDTINAATAIFDTSALAVGSKFFTMGATDPANYGIMTVVARTTTVITVQETLVTEGAGDSVLVSVARITSASSLFDTDALAAQRDIKTLVSTGGANDNAMLTIWHSTASTLTFATGTVTEAAAAGKTVTITRDFWRLVWDTGSAGALIKSLISSNGYVIACVTQTGGLSYAYSATGNNGQWTVSSGSVTDVDFMCPLGANVWAFRGLKEARVASISPPVNSSWGGVYNVGSSSYDFTSVVNHDDYLMIGKRDGLYSIDEYGNAIAVSFGRKFAPHPLNFRRMYSWNGLLFVPLGYGSLWVWRNGQATADYSPREFAPYDDNFHGIIGGLSDEDNWILVVARGAVNGNYYNVGLLAGTLINDEYGTRWVWHPLASWVDDDAHFALVTRDRTTNHHKLWLGRGAGEDYIPSYITLPRATDNPLQSTDDVATVHAYHFASGVYIITSWWDGGLRGMTKAFSRLTLNADNLCNITPAATSELRYIEADYQIDDGSWVVAATSGFTLAATAEADGVAKEQTFSFPSSATGKKIRLRFKLYTTKTVASAAVNPVETPVLNLPFILRAIPRPESRKVVSFSLKCEDGLPGNQSAAQTRTTLDTARANAWPITITGPMGDSYTGTIQSPTPREHTVNRKTPTDKPTSTIDVVLLEAVLA